MLADDEDDHRGGLGDLATHKTFFKQDWDNLLSLLNLHNSASIKLQDTWIVGDQEVIWKQEMMFQPIRDYAKRCPLDTYPDSHHPHVADGAHRDSEGSAMQQPTNTHTEQPQKGPSRLYSLDGRSRDTLTRRYKENRDQIITIKSSHENCSKPENNGSPQASGSCELCLLKCAVKWKERHLGKVNILHVLHGRAKNF